MSTHEDRPLAIAAFRHRLIAAALESEGEGVAAALKEAAARPHRNPAGEEVRVSLSTLWKWLAACRQGGLLALRPKPRQAWGSLRAFARAILDAAIRLRRENPKRSTRTILDILARMGLIQPGQVVRSTLDRHFDRAGFSRKRQGTAAMATVHKKLSTVEVAGMRFAVTPTLRGRKVQVLYDPSDLAYVIIVYDGRVIEHAVPHKSGVTPIQPEPDPPLEGKPYDYLGQLLSDHERHRRVELSALRLQAPTIAELDLPGLVALLESCRGVALNDQERSEAAAFRRRLRPLDAEASRAALEGIRRRLGPGLHLSQYLQTLEGQLVRTRLAAKKAATPKGSQ